MSRTRRAILLELALTWMLPCCGWAGDGEAGRVLDGLNIWGRPGLFVEDTARAFSPGAMEMAGNLFYEHYGDREIFLSPLGMNWGLSNKLDLYLSGTLQTIDYKASGSTVPRGLNRVTGGGTYGIQSIVKGLCASMALDVSLGPFFPGFGPYTTDLNPKFTATYVLDNKLLVSSEYGVYFAQAPYPVYQEFSLGTECLVVAGMTAIVEFLHHTMGGPDVPGTIGLLGFRTSGYFQLQGFLGAHVDSMEAPDFVTGFSILMNP